MNQPSAPPDRPRRHRAGAVIAAGITAAALVLSSCSAIAPSQGAADDFVEYFGETYPDWILDFAPTQDATLPFVGGLYGEVNAQPDTPDDVVQEMLDDIIAWEAPSRVDYRPVGVLVGGVGICAASDQDEQRRTLRTALLEHGLSLTGSWVCPTGAAGAQPVRYRGTLDEVIADATAITDLGDADLAAMVMDGAIANQRSSFTGTWQELAEYGGVQDAFAEINSTVGLRHYDITGRSITIAIGPTVGVEHVAADVSEVLGNDIEVTVVLGGDDAAMQQRYEQWAPIADDLRGLAPGSSAVGTDTGLVASVPSGSLDDAIQVLSGHSPGISVTLVIDRSEDLDRGPLRLTTQTGPDAGTGLPILDAIAADDRIAGGTVTDHPIGGPTSPAMSLSLSLDTADPDAVAALKPIVPTGSTVSVTGLSQWRTVTFTAAERIATGDIEHTDNTYHPADLVEAWNEG